jgi:hypothetical protein
VRPGVEDSGVAEMQARSAAADGGLEMSETPLVFFAERGFTLDFHVEDDVIWADLRSVNEPALVIRRYSRASDAHAPALRAEQRWHYEQAR